MIRQKVIILSVLIGCCNMAVVAQEKDGQVMQRMKEFHALMVKGDTSVNAYLDDSLSYGHSNGWVESKSDFIADLERRLDYHSITEDSVQVGVNGKVAHVRFIGSFDVTMDGKQIQIKLSVLEIWVKNKKTWRIFARQAIRI
jgi:hypothetical protein